MAFTAEQQGRIDAAQQKLDAAKLNYDAGVKAYNLIAADIAPCYKDPVPSSGDASTWFNAFSKGPCVGKGSCSVSDCKSNVDIANNIIPNLKGAYNILLAAQANYDKVFAEVTAEAQADPAFILQQNQIASNAEANKLKWAFAIVVVVVVSFGIYAYFKWFRK